GYRSEVDNRAFDVEAARMCQKGVCRNPLPVRPPGLPGKVIAPATVRRGHGPDGDDKFRSRAGGIADGIQAKTIGGKYHDPGLSPSVLGEGEIEPSALFDPGRYHTRGRVLLDLVAQLVGRIVVIMEDLIQVSMASHGGRALVHGEVGDRSGQARRDR